MNEGGVLELKHSKSKELPASEYPLEYLLAHFGTKVIPDTVDLTIIVAKPSDGCGAIENNVKGKMVLVRRGGCPFVKKAENVQAAGGAVVVIGSPNPYLLRMGVEPRWKGLNTIIPVIMVSKRVYGILVAESFSNTLVVMKENNAINSTVWDTISKYSEGQGWPHRGGLGGVKTHFEELKTEFTHWPDRLAAISDAFSKHEAALTGGDKSKDKKSDNEL